MVDLDRAVLSETLENMGPQMNLSDIQRVLAKAGWYAGKIDGADGPMTQAAIIEALRGTDTQGLSEDRRRIGAAQAGLNRLGHEAGAVDGYAGHNTLNALESFLAAEAGKPLVVNRIPNIPQPTPVLGLNLPRQKDCGAFYGEPIAGVEKNIVTFDLPYALRLDYALDQTVTRARLHRLCAPAFVAAMVEVRDHYGADRQRDLGLDRYAGGYMPRKMRGGSSWSMHAYGCAVDFYAAPNGLKTRCPQALFCGPEYKPFLDIMQSHGWLPAGRLWGGDFMHFQMARL